MKQRFHHLHNEHPNLIRLKDAATTPSNCKPSNCNGNDNDNVNHNDNDDELVTKKFRPNQKRYNMVMQKKHLLLWIILLVFLVLGVINRRFLFKTLCRGITLYFQSQSQFKTTEHSLWRGSLPDSGEILPTSSIYNIQDQNSRVNIELVVSHCNLPLNWIFDWASPFVFSNITIISKCNETVLGVPSGSNIIRLPNVGRCDHSYAHHINRNYNRYNNEHNEHVHLHSNDDNVDNVDDEDAFVVFLKDSDNSNRNHYTRHRSLNEMIQISKTIGFACHEEPSWVWSQQSLLTLHPVCQISAYHNWTLLQDYTQKTYTRLRRDNNSEFASKNGTTLGEYAQNMGIGRPPVDIVPVCYGGNFMAQRRQLTRKNPRMSWKRIETSLSRANNIAEGHFMERLWATVLGKPLEHDMVDRLMHQQRNVCRADKNYVGVLTK
jgi:hypothetical protein